MMNPDLGLMSPNAWALLPRGEKVAMLTAELFGVMDQFRWIVHELDRHETCAADLMEARRSLGSAWMPED